MFRAEELPLRADSLMLHQPKPATNGMFAGFGVFHLCGADPVQGMDNHPSTIPLCMEDDDMEG